MIKTGVLFWGKIDESMPESGGLELPLQMIFLPVNPSWN